VLVQCVHRQLGFLRADRRNHFVGFILTGRDLTVVIRWAVISQIDGNDRESAIFWAFDVGTGASTSTERFDDNQAIQQKPHLQAKNDRRSCDDSKSWHP